ncbi:MAG: hypothetical protein ACI9GB_003635, partial [Halioglobus sp.]
SAAITDDRPLFINPGKTLCKTKAGKSSIFAIHEDMTLLVLFSSAARKFT